MSLAFHYLSPHSSSPSPSSSALITSFFPRNPSLSLAFGSCRPPNTLHFQIPNHNPQSSLAFVSINPIQSRLRVSLSGAAESDAGAGDFSLDSILSAAELFCLVSSLIGSIAFALNCAISSYKNVVLAVFEDRVFVGAFLLLVAGVGIGAWIRRRQWKRMFRRTVKGVLEVNLVERIEKLEEDLKSSATLIRVMSRQLEKLGIRFRVTRKALKKPIEEAADLAQKTSEATRALAIQEDILEKELAEIQKVLLAMQEQQQKQLELILAIGKSGKLWESRQEHSQAQGNSSINRNDPVDECLEQKKVHEI